MADGCVTAGTWSATRPGTPMAVPGGQTCLSAGGRPGLIFGGSGTIPNGRFVTVGSPSSAGLTAALAAAGLGSMGSRGFTFDDAGKVARPAVTPGDDYDLGPAAYLVIPQRRWMANLAGHYDFNPHMTGYAEASFSNNRVSMQLPPSGIGGNFLLNVNNPYLSASMQEVLRQLDLAETGTIRVTNGTSSLTTTAGDAPADVVVVVRGPDAPVRLVRKSRNMGVWLNSRPVLFEGAPGFYMTASTRPLSDIADFGQLRRLGVGVNHLRINAPEESRTVTRYGVRDVVVSRLGEDYLDWRRAVIRLKEAAQLYDTDPPPGCVCQPQKALPSYSRPKAIRMIMLNGKKSTAAK